MSGSIIRGFADHYLLKHNEVPHRSKRSADHHSKRLTSDSRVVWSEQQQARIRNKRDYIEERSTEDRIYRHIQNSFNDPLFKDQWYLRDDRVDVNSPKVDLHVMPVWNMNITGRGVVVTILDDGIERTHDDLKENYDPKASTDLNSNEEGDDDPMPRYDPTNENKHGTRCAGEVAMAANNNKCGVGIAFNARIGGVRMLDGTVTDSLEAEAIKFNHKYVDIYSASWGPNDDGHTVEGPGKMAKQAFEDGITEGRGGKGVLYVWASGNGGRLKDNCDCDGYTGSIYTMSISSASQTFHKPWYGERCASTMATTYSSGGFEDKKVVSTDLHNTCTRQHTGTSAAAPMAAGIFALLLEANPNLTWRDVQHLVAWTSQTAPLDNKENGRWKTNGAGFQVNTAFGFGLLDTAGLVTAANPNTWVNVPQHFKCVVKATSSSGLPKTLRAGQMPEIEIHTTGCEHQDNEVRHLEHIILTIDATYKKRGDLELSLVSPSGTKVMLLSKRDYDKSNKGYKEWPLMSVHTWGENPKGTWKVIFSDGSGDTSNGGSLEHLTLTLYGSKEEPHHMRNGPREYNRLYNKVKNEKKNDPKHTPVLTAQYGENSLLEKVLEELIGSHTNPFRRSDD